MEDRGSFVLWICETFFAQKELSEWKASFQTKEKAGRCGSEKMFSGLEAGKLPAESWRMQLRANRGTEMESEGENSYAADQGEALSRFCAAL